MSESTKDDATPAATKAEDNDDDSNNLDAVFDALIVAPSETLSVTEFTNILHEMGLNPSEDEVLTLLSSVGLEGMESHITREMFHMLMENEAHDTSLHAAAFGGEAPEEGTATEAAAATAALAPPTTLRRKKSAKENTGIRHSDMYWVDFTKEEWPNFPKGLDVDEQNRVVSFTVPTDGTMRADFVAPSVSDILLMVDEKGVDKRLSPSLVLSSIATRLKTNGSVHLKFRRHVGHDHYTGEYFVSLHGVPDVGVVENNVILGPLSILSPAYHHHVRLGDKLLSINNEVVIQTLNTEMFQTLCDTALTRDGSLTLHLEHTEHRAEHHHDVIHPSIHKGMRAFFGGGCWSKRAGANDDDDDDDDDEDLGRSAKSYADAV